MKCDICFECFNTNFRKPMTVMQFGHTFCLKCLDNLKNYEYKCPKDREPITNQKPNYALLDLLNSSNLARKVFKRLFSKYWLNYIG